MTRSRDLRFWLATFFGALALIGSVAATPAAPADAAPLKEARATRATCPLTGKKAARSSVRRPAVAVRVSNSSDARPQISVGSADLVIETPVEGGLTRLMPVFHCSGATTTGPVRSARFDDAEIVSPFARFLGFSGANARVMTELQSSGLTLATEATATSISRDPAGSTDVNSVRADITALRSLARAAGLGKPAATLRFGDLQRSRTSVASVTLDFGSTEVGYRWANGSWIRSQDGSAFVDPSGKTVRPTNVLVQEVTTSASGSLFDSLGVASPRFDLRGSGRAFLFRSGKLIAGTWTDPGAGAPVFKTKKGAVMNLAPGRTWLELVPSATGDLQGSIAFR